MRLLRRSVRAMSAVLAAGHARSADARIDLVHLFSDAHLPTE